MKIIFWNVDTQYDFMNPNGKLYVRGAEQIEKTLARLTEFARYNWIKIVNTADWHNENSEEISDKPDFIQTFPEHCMRNTKGAGYVPATYPEYRDYTGCYKIDWKQKQLDQSDKRRILQARNIVLYKDKFDVFKGTPHAEEIVKFLSPERAIVYGVATNVCVNDAVNGLLERKIQVYVPTDAIKELPNLGLPYENWQRKGAILTTTDTIFKMLKEKK